MSDGSPHEHRVPSTRERLRPAELLGFSLVLALFTGVIVLFTTREPILAAVFFGVAFIVALVGLAMFGLAITPNKSETEDLEEQDREEQDREEHGGEQHGGEEHGRGD